MRSRHLPVGQLIAACTASWVLVGCGSTNSDATETTQTTVSPTPTTEPGPVVADLDPSTAVITYFSSEGSVAPPSRSYAVTIDAGGAVVEADPTISLGQERLEVRRGAMEVMLIRIGGLAASEPSAVSDCVGGPGVGVSVRADATSDPIASYAVFPCNDDELVWERQINEAVAPGLEEFSPEQFFTD